MALFPRKLRSIALGTVAADADGAFSITIHLPPTVPPGVYELSANGADSATTEVTVLEAASGTEGVATAQPSESVSNDRSAGEAIGLGALTAAFAISGAVLLALSRTRPRRSAN